MVISISLAPEAYAENPISLEETINSIHRSIMQENLPAYEALNHQFARMFDDLGSYMAGSDAETITGFHWKALWRIFGEWIAVSSHIANPDEIYSLTRQIYDSDDPISVPEWLRVQISKYLFEGDAAIKKIKDDTNSRGPHWGFICTSMMEYLDGRSGEDRHTGLIS